MGDLSATFCESDRSSNKSYTYDHMYREFINKNGLQPIEEYSDPTHTPRPRTQLQTTSTCNADGNAAYCNGRSDDILLSKHIADIVHVPKTCETMAYHSDHVPLLAYIDTKSLNFNIPVPIPPTPQPNHQNTLCRPISEKNKPAAQDLACGVTQKLQHTRKMVLCPRRGHSVPKWLKTR